MALVVRLLQWWQQRWLEVLCSRQNIQCSQLSDSSQPLVLVLPTCISSLPLETHMSNLDKSKPIKKMFSEIMRQFTPPITQYFSTPYLVFSWAHCTISKWLVFPDLAKYIFLQQLAVAQIWSLKNESSTECAKVTISSQSDSVYRHFQMYNIFSCLAIDWQTVNVLCPSLEWTQCVINIVDEEQKLHTYSTSYLT